MDNNVKNQCLSHFYSKWYDIKTAQKYHVTGRWQGGEMAKRRRYFKKSFYETLKMQYLSGFFKNVLQYEMKRQNVMRWRKKNVYFQKHKKCSIIRLFLHISVMYFESKISKLLSFLLPKYCWITVHIRLDDILTCGVKLFLIRNLFL